MKHCEDCPMTKISEAVSDAGMVKYGRVIVDDEDDEAISSEEADQDP